MTLRLEGDANDYVGKGLSGGRIVVRPDRAATFAADEQIIAGNVDRLRRHVGRDLPPRPGGRAVLRPQLRRDRGRRGRGRPRLRVHDRRPRRRARPDRTQLRGRHVAAATRSCSTSTRAGSTPSSSTSARSTASDADELRGPGRAARRGDRLDGGRGAAGRLDRPSLARFTEVMPRDYQAGARGPRRGARGEGLDEDEAAARIMEVLHGVTHGLPQARPRGRRAPPGRRARPRLERGLPRRDRPRAAADHHAPRPARCMDCGIPFCHQGCPLGNIIPEWNDLVWRDDWDGAIDRLHATNNFPEFTGRLCPAPCETACVLGINQDPVTIKNVEVAIIDRAWDVGLRPPAAAGVALGQDGRGDRLRAGRARRGPAADPGRAHRRGLRAGRQDRRAAALRHPRVQDGEEAPRPAPRPDAARGHGLPGRRRRRRRRSTGDQLRERYDAVVLAIGSTVAPRPARCPAASSAASTRRWSTSRSPTGSSLGERRSTDQITADRQGRRDHRRRRHRRRLPRHVDPAGRRARSPSSRSWPQPPEDRPTGQPWPTYPMTFRVSSAHEEGGDRVYAVSTQEFLGDDDGRVRALRLVEVDATFQPVAGTEREIPAQLVLLAMGFTGPEQPGLLEQLGVDLDERGNVAPRRVVRLQRRRRLRRRRRGPRPVADRLGDRRGAGRRRGRRHATSPARPACRADRRRAPPADRLVGADPPRRPTDESRRDRGTLAWNDPTTARVERVRRAKIVCTLGPAVSTPEKIRELVDAGMDVARLNMSHGSLRRPRARLPTGAARPPTRPATGSASSPTSRARRSGSRRSPTARSRSTTAQEFTITTRDVAGDATICGTTYKGLPGDVTRRRPDPDRRRQGAPARSTGVDDTDVTTRVVGRRQGQQPQGHQPARRRRVACPRCRRRTTRTCAGRCTLGVDFVALSLRALAPPTSRTYAQIMREEGIMLPIIAKIEKPQAIDNLDEVVEAFDALHGGPRRPRRGVPARGRAVPAEAGRSTRRAATPSR